MPSGFYDVFKQDLFDGSVNLDASDVIHVALMDTNHDTDATALENDAVWGDGSGGTVSLNEITNTAGAAYIAGGQVLGSPTVVTATGTTTFDGVDSEWLIASFTCEHIVLFDRTNEVGGSGIEFASLIATVDIGTQTVTAGTFTIQWNALGIITMT